MGKPIVVKDDLPRTRLIHETMLKKPLANIVTSKQERKRCMKQSKYLISTYKRINSCNTTSLENRSGKDEKLEENFDR